MYMKPSAEGEVVAPWTAGMGLGLAITAAVTVILRCRPQSPRTIAEQAAKTLQ